MPQACQVELDTNRSRTQFAALLRWQHISHNCILVITATIRYDSIRDDDDQHVDATARRIVRTATAARSTGYPCIMSRIIVP